MAKKQRPKKRLKSPWLDKKWQLITANGLSDSLLLRRGKKLNGKKTVKDGDNQFWLVVGSKTGKRINFLTVKGVKKNNMSRFWKQCALVPRGTQPVAFVNKKGQALIPLGPNPPASAIKPLVSDVLASIDDGRRVSAARLECDVVVRDKAGKKNFAVLRMFQVAKAIASKPLLVVHVSIDGGLPDGNGGGGSVHN
jgi:hypothetical protein